jgi:hypothetical protein
MSLVGCPWSTRLVGQRADAAFAKQGELLFNVAECIHISVGGKGMRATRDYVLAVGLVFGITLGVPVALSGVDAPVATAALTRFIDGAAAQATTTCTNGTAGIITGTGDVCNSTDNDIFNTTTDANGEGGRGGNATSSGGSGGNGGNGGFSALHDVGNASADASNSVTVGDITTGDLHAPDLIVDARGATRPVVVVVAGSFLDSGVDIFAPSGNAQAGTTGGNGNLADSSGGSGGDGGNATSSGGNGTGGDTTP